MTRQTSIQLDENTEALIAFLKDRGFGTTTNIIRTAIKRMAEQERKRTMTRKNATAKADAIEAVEGTFAQAITDAGNEYRENLSLGMPKDEAVRIWQERQDDAEAIRNEAIDHIEIEFA